MLKHNIINNFGIVEFAQVGIESDGKFTGLYLYNNILSYVNQGETVKKDELENLLKNDEIFKDVIENTKTTLSECGIGFNKERKRFIIVNVEKAKNISSEKFDTNYYEIILKGNQDRKPEEIVKGISENIFYSLSDVITSLKLLKNINETEYEKLTKILNISIK
jgi:hypothetical protein